MIRALTNGVAAIALMLSCQTAAASAAAPGPLTIAADKPGAVIDRNIFGQFAEMLGEGIYGGVWVGPDSPIPNVRGIRSDVVAALRALRVPNVRWPGGCFADSYDWRDGIGPQSARVSHINQWGNVIEPNAFGTHEFMDFVDQIGSEAYISVNVGRGTPQQAAEWVEYMTTDLPTTLGKQRGANGRKEPWQIRYLGLGNENWGCGGNMRAEHYVDLMKVFATYTKSYHPQQQSSFIKPATVPMRKIAVGEDLGKTSYTEAVMQAWKERVAYAWNIDALSLHYYTGDPQPMMAASEGFGEREYASILRNTLKMNDMISEHSAIMDRYDPEKKVGLAIDEWGLWLRPQGEQFMFLRQQNSMRDGIAAALNFNIFARHADRVRMANIAQMVNVIQAMILTDGPRMVLTPTYHVHKMYLPFQDATFLPLTFNTDEYKFDKIVLPRVDVIAARGKDGKVWLSLTNLDPNAETEVTASVPGVVASRAVGEVLTAASFASVNTFDAPNTVQPRPYSAAATGGKLVLRLPPHSVMVVRLEP